MLLASAGLLGSVAVAQAQPAPAPPPPAAPPPAAPAAPPPAAPAAPPPAEFGVAPAALPAAPVAAQPVPTVSFGATPGADTTTPAATPDKKQNPFTWTRLNWGNSGTTRIFGVGAKTIGSDDQQFTTDLSLNLRYYVLNETFDKAYVNVNAGFGVELTNSDSTAKLRQVQWKDTALSAGYTHTIYRNADKSMSFAPLIGASFVLPTAKESYGTGKYLTTGVTAAMISLLPLAGPKSDWFSDVFALTSFGYSHLFAKSYTAANSNISQVARTAPDGSENRSDQLSGASMAADKVKLNLTYYLTIYKDLSLANTWEISVPFKRSFDATCVNIPTGPACVGESNKGTINPVTTFDIGLSYTFFNYARLDVGYTSTSPELGDNGGKRRTIFYGPDAVFYGNVSVYLDTILDKTLGLTEPEKKTARARSSHFF
jgi:hypothetical protein